jgi:hypothetical protein
MDCYIPVYQRRGAVDQRETLNHLSEGASDIVVICDINMLVIDSHRLRQIEIVTDDVSVSLSRLEKLEDLMDSAAVYANNAAIAARLHEVAYKLGIVSAHGIGMVHQCGKLTLLSLRRPASD